MFNKYIKKLNKVYGQLFFPSFDIKTMEEKEESVIHVMYDELNDVDDSLKEIYSKIESLENKILLLTKELMWKVDKKGKDKLK